VADQYGINGNFSSDPYFCDLENGDLAIAEDSPCARDNSGEACGLIGALGVGCASTPVAEADLPEPVALCLGPPIPNPFNPVTQIAYGIPAGSTPSRVTLRVYDVTGRQVATLVDRNRGPGMYDVAWDGRDQKGAEVASGVYFYRLTWKGKAETRRMVLLK
jgi:hypothetical protein